MGFETVYDEAKRVALRRPIIGLALPLNRLVFIDFAPVVAGATYQWLTMWRRSHGCRNGATPAGAPGRAVKGAVAPTIPAKIRPLQRGR